MDDASVTGFRLAAVAGVVAITAAPLVVLRGYLAGAISPVTTINILGVAALTMGTLRLVGAFEIERRTGPRWTIGGLILGVLELGRASCSLRPTRRRGRR